MTSAAAIVSSEICFQWKRYQNLLNHDVYYVTTNIGYYFNITDKAPVVTLYALDLDLYLI